MSWGAVAVAGAAVVGSVMASDSAGNATESAEDTAYRQLQFDKQRVEDWKDAYGGIQDNLSEYYNNLTPEYYEVQGLEAFQKEQQAAMENIKSTLAQRGIEDSGIALATEVSSAQSGAVQRATIRAQAPSLAAEEKRGFLQVGLGQDPGESLSRTFAQRSADTAANARAQQQAAGAAAGTAVSSVGTALADYFNTPTADTSVAPKQEPGVSATTQDYSGYS